MNKIETFLINVHSDRLNPSFLSIGNEDSVQWAQNTLDENDQDYLEGGISFIYRFEVLLEKEMETSDLLITWQSLIRPILFPREKSYSVELLDSPYIIHLEEVGEKYLFRITTHFDHSEWVSEPILIQEYKELVRNGFLAFGDYLMKHQFTFAEESLYQSFNEDYERIKVASDNV